MVLEGHFLYDLTYTRSLEDPIHLRQNMWAGQGWDRDTYRKPEVEGYREMSREMKRPWS